VRHDQVVSVEELLTEALQAGTDIGTLEQRLLVAGGYRPPALFGVDPTVRFTGGTRLPAPTLERLREQVRLCRYLPLLLIIRMSLLIQLY
jgi:hypothetical protein